MQFGVQFFPDVGPDVKSAAQYWGECLALTDLIDPLGFAHVRTVEHHFQSYGGYSPNPHIFLTAAAMRTEKARLVTGAVLPVFNNPLKIAGEIGMLDAISNGRLDCGFGRAFLPLEFEIFGRSLDDSRARFDEGIEQVRRLLEQENVSAEGEFHSFQNATTYPRPTQQPRPPIWIAALISPGSFETAGKAGYNVMAIPLPGGQMNELISIYRDAWSAAGHTGEGQVMLAHHMFCHESDETALEISRDPINRYLKSIVTAASRWLEGSASADYPGYDKVIAGLAKETIDTQMEKGGAFIGSPERIIDTIEKYIDQTGGFDIASLQVNFNDLPVDIAERSMRLFSEKVLPHFS